MSTIRKDLIRVCEINILLKFTPPRLPHKKTNIQKSFKVYNLCLDKGDSLKIQKNKKRKGKGGEG